MVSLTPQKAVPSPYYAFVAAPRTEAWRSVACELYARTAGSARMSRVLLPRRCCSACHPRPI